MKKLLAIFVCFLTLFSCGSSSTSDGKYLTLNLSEEGKTIDTALQTDVSSGDLHTFFK